MQLEANKVDKILPFDAIKIINVRKNKLNPPHVDIKKKEKLRAAGLGKIVNLIKMDLHSH